MNNEEFVRGLFDTLLGRPADPIGLRDLLRLMEDGTDPKDIFKLIYKSDEYSSRKPQKPAYDLTHQAVTAIEAESAFSPAKQKDFLKFLCHVAPCDVIDFEKIRVGRDNDGGYVMIDDFEGITSAYSLGISDDVSWDRQIADRGIMVHQYDHSIDALPESHNNFRWSKLRIAKTSDMSEGAISLADAFRANNHHQHEDCLLKVDIEGSEWEVFETIEQGLLNNFRQIIVELHDIHELAIADRYDQMFRAMCNLSRNHKTVHVHGNNNGRWAIIGGIAVPDILEITLIRSGNRQFRASTTILPTALDQSNRPGQADFQLGTFQFESPST